MHIARQDIAFPARISRTKKADSQIPCPKLQKVDFSPILVTFRHSLRFSHHEQKNIDESGI
jgi:hypothetical protein